MRRLYTCLVSLFIATAALWAFDFQSGGLYYNITSSTAPYTAEVTCDGSAATCYQSLSTVTVPATVENEGTTYTVTAIGQLAFADLTTLTSITLPTGLTAIKYAAFAGCKGLQSITFEGSVTTIGQEAFFGCSSLTAITIPQGATEIGYLAFYSCTHLATITLPASVTKVDYSAFDRTAWKNNHADGPLYLNTVLYGYKGNMPAGTTLVIQNGTIAIADGAFENYTQLAGVVFPNSVTTIGYQAFSETNLLNCTIPSTVTFVDEDAFYHVPNITYNGTLEDAPWGAKTLNGHVEGNLVYTDATKTTISACSGQATGDIVIPAGVTTIGKEAFSLCNEITSITIPEGVTTIEEEAFYNCDKLEAVKLPSTLTSIGEEAFQQDPKLFCLTVPDGVTSIGDDAFEYIGNIVYNGTATGSPWGAKSVNGVVDGNLVYADAAKTTLLACDAKATGTLTIPNSVTQINEDAFLSCTELTTVVIPATVTTIKSYAFNDVLNINYSGTATGSPWGARSMNGYAEGIFAYQDATKTWLRSCNIAAKGDIVVPDGVKTIEYNAFADCEKIQSITLPASMDSIGWKAFNYCSATSLIVLATTPPAADANAFYNMEEGIVVYVPCGTKATYTAEDCKWKTFADDMVERFGYTLSVTSQDEAMGTVRITQAASCSDDTALFEATAQDGYQFKQWSDGNTDNPRSVVVDEDKAFVAQFVTTPTGLEKARQEGTVRKMIRNGQVYILRNGTTYTPSGVRVE